MTPDGIPYLGRTPVEGLYLDTGHGHLGWTMSCGSASVVADLICGRRPDIDLEGTDARRALIRALIGHRGPPMTSFPGSAGNPGRPTLMITTYLPSVALWLPELLLG